MNKMFSKFNRAVVISRHLVAILVTFPCLAAAYEEVNEIPNPRLDSGWVVDMTGSIGQDELARIDEFCESIHRSGGTEMAVVMIRTTGGKSVEAFALELFNLWQIGRAAENDGILFLVAKDDRSMRIELGDGIDGDDEQQIARQILDEEVTPRFRAGEYGKGLYDGAFSTAIRILSLAENEIANETNQPAEVSPVTQPPATDTGKRTANPLEAGEKQRGQRSTMPLWIGGGLLGLGSLLFIIGRYWLRYRKRLCERCETEMVLLEETQDDEFLESPEQTEERIGSVNYDVWACLTCDDVTKVRYGRFFTRYSKCPECGYITKFKITKTLIAATTRHAGRVHVEEQCVHCPYHHETSYATPRLSANPSSSSFGRGGHSSAGRSSGGFGGGRSSGGGASGRW